MPTDPILHERLKDFLERYRGLHSRQIAEADFVQPGFGDWRERFLHFEWLSVIGPQASGGGASAVNLPRIAGIRKLVDRSPFRLSDLRALGFKTVSTRYPIRPPLGSTVEHYLIAEVPSAEEVRISLCMHVPPDQWFVLDEHLLSRG